MVVQFNDGRTVRLSDKPLGRGGEGIVYTVEQAPGLIDAHVGKLYKPEKRVGAQEQKLQFLVDNPPYIRDKGGHPYLIWPTALLYEQGSFAGFMMPRTSGVELEALCLNQLDRSLPSEWQRFARSSAKSKLLRLNVCRNLCHAVAALHHKQNYTLVDMKPVNIFVDAKGLVSIVDLDSVQVTERGHLLFENKAFTPEYTPPEGSKQQLIRRPSWDNFTLAVILYRLLLGIHPFAGSFHDPAVTDVSGAIQAGLYPHGRQRSAFAVVPPPHDFLKEYPSEIAELFRRCFEDGIFAPEQRPTAEQWFAALHTLLSEPAEIVVFEATPSLVVDDTPAQIQWEVRNAQSIKLKGIGKVESAGTIQLPVRQDTILTLEAISLSGQTVSRDLTIRIDQRPPDIRQFIVTPSAILEGESVQLRWQTERAASVSIAAGSGSAKPQPPGAVSADFTPKQSTRYELTAASAFGVPSSAVAEVLVYPRPKIGKFSASHSKIKAGQQIELVWQVQDCQEIWLIEGRQRHNVTAEVNKPLRPTRTTIYILEVLALDGSTTLTQQLTVDVLPPVELKNLRADRTFTMQTFPVRLSWHVRNADKVTLEPGGIDVTGKNTLEVHPSSSTTYEVVARNDLFEERLALRIEVQSMPRLDGLRLPPPPSIRLSPPPVVGHWEPHDISRVRQQLFDNHVLPSPAGGETSYPVGSIYARLRRALANAVSAVLPTSIAEKK